MPHQPMRPLRDTGPSIPKENMVRNSKMSGDVPERRSQANSVLSSSEAAPSSEQEKRDSPPLHQDKPQLSKLQIQVWVSVRCDWPGRWAQWRDFVSAWLWTEEVPPWGVTYCLKWSYPRSLTIANHHQGAWILPATVPGQEKPLEAVPGGEEGQAGREKMAGGSPRWVWPGSSAR